MQFHAFDLPAANPLFNDYLKNTESARSFYRFHPADGFQDAIAARSASAIDRAALVSILERQNNDWDAPAATMENIEALGDSKTLAVVTGQQVGVLGGPLYSFYKTITTIKLARRLSEEQPQHRFVPVFWLEVNDNDFEEISKMHYLTKEDEWRSLAVSENPLDVDRAVAARQLDTTVTEWRSQFEDDTFETEFRDAALDLFLNQYGDRTGYTEAFARLLLQFFGDDGLVLINPVDKGVCRTALHLFSRVIESEDTPLSVLREQSARLEAKGYPTQIHLRDNQTLLFFNDENMKRSRIDRMSDGTLVVKDSAGSHPISRASLLQSCSEQPHYMSPNVALRPLMQDTLLPTVAYVGGPAEVAYFAQISALYDYFDLPMPVIVPRHRLTIVESKIQRLIKKNDLQYQEILDGDKDFVSEVIRRGPNQKVFDQTTAVRQDMLDLLDKLGEQLATVDPALSSGHEKTRNNIMNAFEKLSQRITRSLEEKNETQVRQLQRILTHLLPEGGYQERHLNMLYFCIKYGPDFLKQLEAVLPDDTTPHYVIEL